MGEIAEYPAPRSNASSFYFCNSNNGDVTARLSGEEATRIRSYVVSLKRVRVRIFFCAENAQKLGLSFSGLFNRSGT